MKKILLICAVLLTICIMGASLTTTTAGYEPLLISAAGAETDLIAATGYNVGVPSPAAALAPKDLTTQRGESKFNGAVLSCFATSSDNDDVTMSVYGIAVDGAPERIGSLLWTFGTAIKSSGVRWADTVVATVTSTNSDKFTIEDSGQSRVVTIRFDVTGYRYLYAIAHTTTTGSPTNITVLMRPF